MNLIRIPIPRLVSIALFVVLIVLAAQAAFGAPAAHADPPGTPDSSCQGDEACRFFSSGSVGANSCNGFKACEQSGVAGQATIGFGSCLGQEACQFLGSGSISSAGNESCVGPFACWRTGSGGAANIGNRACNGILACGRLVNDSGNATIGEGSCNGDGSPSPDFKTGACGEAGGGGTLKIGRFSCNGPDACKGLGAEADATVGDCEMNLVPVLECEPDARRAYDSDLDGACNRGAMGLLCEGIDRCSNTPAGAEVDENGCSQAQVDSDGDGYCNRGVSSSLCWGSDRCANTAADAVVDENGCARVQADSNLDGKCNRGVTSQMWCPPPP